MEASGIIPRTVEKRIVEALQRPGLVLVEGARGTGKTTLLELIARRRGMTLARLDSFESCAEIASDPEAFLDREGNVVIDDVDRLPPLLAAVMRRAGHDTLSSSMLISLSPKVRKQPGLSAAAGNFSERIILLPLTRSEREDGLEVMGWHRIFESPVDSWPSAMPAVAERRDWRVAVCEGGLPGAVLTCTSTEERFRWFGQYTERLLDRDFGNAVSAQNLLKLRSLVVEICNDPGALEHQTELAYRARIAQPTVYRLLKVLEASHQLFRLRALQLARRERLIRAPRLYWSDTGVSAFLSRDRELGRRHLISVILTDIRSACQMHRGMEVFHWRSVTGDELPLVLSYGGKLIPIDVVSERDPVPGDVRTLMSFQRQYGDLVHGALLLHGGSATLRVVGRTVVSPWWHFV